MREKIESLDQSRRARARLVKAIVYGMCFDEGNARFADFGAFSVGIQMPLDAPLTRLSL